MKLPKIEIKYKISKGDHIKIKESKDAYEAFKTFYKNLETFVENVVVMYLAIDNSIVGMHHLSKGGTSVAIMETKTIAATALNIPNCTGVIISHNHPSGNLTPSSADLNVTNKIKKALDLFDIQLLDHLILGIDNYISFVDNGHIH